MQKLTLYKGEYKVNQSDEFSNPLFEIHNQIKTAKVILNSLLGKGVLIDLANKISSGLENVSEEDILILIYDWIDKDTL